MASDLVLWVDLEGCVTEYHFVRNPRRKTNPPLDAPHPSPDESEAAPRSQDLHEGPRHSNERPHRSTAPSRSSEHPSSFEHRRSPELSHSVEHPRPERSRSHEPPHSTEQPRPHEHSRSFEP